MRDDFTVLTAGYLRSQAKLIFIGFILSLPMSVYGASPSTGSFVAYGLPLVILCIAAAALLTLPPPIATHNKADLARAAINRIWLMCFLLSLAGVVWGITSWIVAPVETRTYYPVIMAIGGLTAGYFLTAVREVAVTVVLVTLVPIAAMLGNSEAFMDRVIAATLILAIVFQLIVISRHHRLLLDLLEQQCLSDQQARHDPLTGLANRRALLEHFSSLARHSTHVRLMIIDIDRFKSVNDRHGHDVGDEVLRAFSQLLAHHAREEISAARIGGEEFALLGSSKVLDAAIALQLLVEIRSAPMPHGEQVTASIGVADGIAATPDDWDDLYGKADHALYRAKNDGRNRVRSFIADADPICAVDKKPVRTQQV